MEPARASVARRICYLPLDAVAAEDALPSLLDRIGELGFDAVMTPSPFRPGVAADDISTADHCGSHSVFDGGSAEAALAQLARTARLRGLDLFMDLALHCFAADHPLVAAHPQAFILQRSSGGAVPVDPRRPAPSAGEARSRLEAPECADLIGDFAVGVLREWARCGVAGVRVLQPHAAAPAFWRRVIAETRAATPGFVFIAEAEGAPRESVLALAGCGFDALTSSLPFWNGRARWFVEEYEALRSVAPLMAVVAPPGGDSGSSGVAGGEPALLQRLALAPATGLGLLCPMPPSALDDAVRAANALSGKLSRFGGELRALSGEGGPVTALLRANAADVRHATAALLVLINPDLEAATPAVSSGILVGSGAEFEPFARIDGDDAPFAALRPGEVRLLLARRSHPISRGIAAGAAMAQLAAQAPRLVVEGVIPRVDGGDYPVRRIVGEEVVVEADVFADGHEQLSVELQWRALDHDGGSAVPMKELGNDRWRAAFPLDRLGRYEFVVEGWLDVYGGFRRDFRKKRGAGVAKPVDMLEGMELVRRATKRVPADLKAALKDVTAGLKAASDEEARGDILLDEATAELMRAADDRPHRLRSAAQIVDAERLQARFASWYELFPRSQTDDAARHGTFDDVIARLPTVRAMGFDVLYFPPIHPIGRTNRKGPNNTLTPGPDDPGSPYAIGSQEGGHDAIHPQLGTLDDFRRLVRAAAEHGLEIALDFAIQCSPDHPWLKQHPGWFDWRPDGSIKYAENPPKKYQDIVNVDFYKPEAIPDLWLALRDIVLLWVGEGVKLFRVDNPHTKPLPFWEWMIGEVRAAHPDVVFLAEAFTRPKPMYRLAKTGFSQSYTYFTWRHTKAEFIDYLTELTTTAPKEFFRPHFFVNTPDINPPFLQTSGRAGFLIRAALAATLSGLWGVYSGFELCESEPLPAREEYKDSEKYEIRPRPPRAPGDIVAEITRLNVIRKGHPALQTHLGVQFLPSWNDDVLVYAKATASLDDVVVVAVNLDPHHPQETGFELPLWDWGLGDDAEIAVEDVVWESRFTWRGKSQSVRLEPGQPYAIWSLRAPVRTAS